jgi:hypothetical protein
MSESIDEHLNMAQINERLTQLSKVYNREQKSLKLSCVGDIRVRAGMFLPVKIESLGIVQLMMADEVKHSFDGANHKMSITLKVI